MQNAKNVTTVKRQIMNVLRPFQAQVSQKIDNLLLQFPYYYYYSLDSLEIKTMS